LLKQTVSPVSIVFIYLTLLVVVVVASTLIRTDSTPHPLVAGAVEAAVEGE
jgi:Na+-transporting methylmalonyl-CoA/oxaloacetate decarboxylase gamma subunit